MAHITTVLVSDTFSAWLDAANISYARLNQFAINESSLYANTITANVSLVMGGAATFHGQSIDVRYANGSQLNSNLANTNLAITNLNTNLTATNTAIRLVDSQRLANTNAYIATMQTIAVERAALANTNAYIALMSTDVQLANTNAYIATKTTESTALSRLANTNAYIATMQTIAVERAALANTNAYIAMMSTDVQLANTNAYIATMLPKAGGTMTGDILMSGADVQLNLGANTAIKQGSANTIVLQTGKAAGLTTALTIDAVQDITVASDIKFPDSGKAMFGASGDLSISHNGSHSNILDSGTGNLYIGGDSAVIITDSSTTKIKIDAYTDAAVTLYYSGSAKLATAAAGGTLTGTWTANTVNIYAASGPALQTTVAGAGQNVHRAIGSHASFTGNVLQPWSVRDTSSAFDFIEAVSNNGSAVPFRVRGDGKVFALNGYEPMTAGGADLGSTTLEFNDLYLNDAGRIWFGYDQDISIIHTADVGLTLQGVTMLTQANSAIGTNVTATGSVTLDLTAATHHRLTLTGNLTLANPSTEISGSSGLLILIQDATGSRTLSLGTDWESPSSGGFTLSTAGNATDIIPYWVLSTGRILMGQIQKNMG
jgi:hypothetical protein